MKRKRDKMGLTGWPVFAALQILQHGFVLVSGASILGSVLLLTILPALYRPPIIVGSNDAPLYKGVNGVPLIAVDARSIPGATDPLPDELAKKRDGSTSQPLGAQTPAELLVPKAPTGVRID